MSAKPQNIRENTQFPTSLAFFSSLALGEQCLVVEVKRGVLLLTTIFCRKKKNSDHLEMRCLFGQGRNKVVPCLAEYITWTFDSMVASENLVIFDVMQ